MHQDVVGRLTPITSVQSAEAGLLVCLDHRGGVDLPYIATLYEKGVREQSGESVERHADDGAYVAWGPSSHCRDDDRHSEYCR